MKHSQKLRSKRPAILAAGIATLFLALAGSSSRAAVTYVGEAILDGTQTDKSGLPATILEDGASPQNALNGIGSGLTYAGGGLFYGLCDRGPNKVVYSGGAPVDNTVSYDCRVQKLAINLTPVGTAGGDGKFAAYTVGVTNPATTVLKNPNGQIYTGISSGIANGLRFDPEGVRVAPDGSFYVSDEYGPFVRHFNQQGKQIGALTLPPGFTIANPQPKGADEISGNTSGRVNNKGMEGIAITPDGKTLVGIMQSPLLQDGGLASLNVRIVVWDLTNPSATPKQYLYQLDSTAFANSEILAINNHKFIIDERDAVAGNTGKKLLYQVDLNQATAPTDLATSAFPGSTASNGMPTAGTPAGVVPLAKTLFADVGQLLVNANAFTTDSANFKTDLPDKLEGYAWGPDLADGRRLLLCTNDNDYAQKATTSGGAITGKGYPNYVFAFAVDPSDVPDFQPQVFDTDAVNSIDHIVVIYQENWTFDGLYGSFPGVNGLANASGASTTQINRLTGTALSADGPTSYNNPAFVPNAGQPATDQVKNPPVALTTDANSGVADIRVTTTNTLQPYDLGNQINPTLTTGDIYHRYWQEQFQIFGTVTPASGPANDAEAGNNSGFVTWSDNPGLVMSHYDATNLPEGLLAQQYTICDNFFHSAFGGSFLNHQFLIAAAAPIYYGTLPAAVLPSIAYLDQNGAFIMNTSGSAAGKFVRDGSITPIVGDQISVTINGVVTPVTITSDNAEAYAGPAGTKFDKHYVVNTTRSVNLGGNGENGLPGNGSGALATLLPSQNDSNPSDPNRTFTPTIGDTLSAANVSWKWYSGGWSQILAYSGSNPSPTTNPTYAATNASLQLQYHHQPFAYFDNYAPFDTVNTVPSQYVGGFAGVGTNGLTAGQSGVTRKQNADAHLQDEQNFFTDVTNGTLPAVSFIKAVGVNNEHPGYASLQQGQAHVASIIQALQANPSVWAHTAVFITYDEHGGRWDHVTPPLRDIWGPGERVPCIVISPLAKKGYVDHAQRDTSSILSTIEQRFGLSSLNALTAAAPNFFDVFTTLDIARGVYAVNPRANSITQTVTITNRSNTTMAGPVQLVLDNLSAGTTLVNKTGTTANNVPNGSAYITATTGSLAPGASVAVPLKFTIPPSGGVNYFARTVTGTANP